MAADQTAVSGRWCREHPDRQAVQRCAECGRPACLSCAVPVRGEVLCTECARRRVGDPAPAPARGLGSRAPDAVATALLGAALLATLLPWDRFGTLNRVLSAWRPGPDPWPFVAGLLLAPAVAAASLALVRWWPATVRYAAVAYSTLAGTSGVAVAVALARSPDFVSHTPAPYVALAGAVGAAVVGLIRLRRAR